MLPEHHIALIASGCVPMQASAQKKDEKIQAVREITSKAGVPLKKKKIIRSFYDTMYSARCPLRGPRPGRSDPFFQRLRTEPPRCVPAQVQAQDDLR